MTLADKTRRDLFTFMTVSFQDDETIRTYRERTAYLKGATNSKRGYNSELRNRTGAHRGQNALFVAG
jgi:hypothetical protein